MHKQINWPLITVILISLIAWAIVFLGWSMVNGQTVTPDTLRWYVDVRGNSITHWGPLETNDMIVHKKWPGETIELVPKNIDTRRAQFLTGDDSIQAIRMILPNMPYTFRESKARLEINVQPTYDMNRDNYIGLSDLSAIGMIDSITFEDFKKFWGDSCVNYTWKAGKLK